MVDLKQAPGMSSIYLVADTQLGPAIHAVGTALTRHGGEAETIKGKVITDRPLYKPGDTVRFKVIFREVDFVDKAVKAAASRDVEVGLYSDYYRATEAVWSTTGVTDEFGTFAG
ncbi:MAG: hypothetical protein GTN49_03470, partial [candidate division Zixibacteria bacterium]|nr:hypothetical protein [candidate division Zixibacteria bacterium]